MAVAVAASSSFLCSGLNLYYHIIFFSMARISSLQFEKSTCLRGGHGCGHVVRLAVAEAVVCFIAAVVAHKAGLLLLLILLLLLLLRLALLLLPRLLLKLTTASFLITAATKRKTTTATMMIYHRH